MKRSETIDEFTISAKVDRPVRTAAMSAVLNGASLDKYSGPWGFEQAAHLFRRTTYGMTYNQIKDAGNSDMDSLLDSVLEDQAPADPPINYEFEEDDSVPIGETWVDKPYLLDSLNQYRLYRTKSLEGWTFGLVLNGGMSIREKMTLFWHNHFVVQATVLRDPKFLYKYISLLRNNATGNFKQLVKDITIDPAMLRYLNGNQNTKNAPNENYARELLELFTIGKGDLAGSGDYSTFTEHDVIEVARILTGWRDQGYLDVLGLEIKSEFGSNRHDDTQKQLSHRFGNAIISGNGADEYEDLIEVIFLQDEVSRYICRKLYRWFVYYKITTEIEQNIIEPLAQILRDNDYEIKPVLRSLLSSEHFYDICSLGPMIKNPLDYLTAPLRQFDVKFPEELYDQYYSWGLFLRALPIFQMQYYEPPNVAGWKAYYQEPSYYRLWVNSVTLPTLVFYSDLMTGGNDPNSVFYIDILEQLKSFDEPTNPNALIDDLSLLIYPQPITQGQRNYLKSVLIPGLPDFEWTVEYSNHLADPQDELLRDAVESKLKALLKAMMRLPEFYLS